ncbi:zinc-dependent peptidase [Halobacteriovorax sp. GB3]|uniref:zinc-dependent peptidase n=1 Tax=Halobacteriovorax sp. GB3 TaxID=2719615 RepID=UPI002362BDFB|nr:zinc-dependent peptidase [Halobacteriovorax sp. GB3]MDD0851714.1 zinc-dependent peptidase [Halobacteriovorax sp. GB3]
MKISRKGHVKFYENNREEWNKILESESEIFMKLPSELKDKLLKHMATFYLEKKWKSDTIENDKIKICMSACLPLINRKTNYYPSVSENFEHFELSDWFSFNAKQFEFEYGKMALKNMNYDFSGYSKRFFFEADELFIDCPRSYEFLRAYYGLDPREWTSED